MKNRILLALFQLATLPSLAQSSMLTQGRTQATGYLIVLPYEQMSGKLLLQVEINGRKRRFILDTGAPTLISGDLFRELQPRVIGKKPMYDANNRVDSMIFTSLDGLVLDGIRFDSVTSVVTEDELLTKCFQVDGVLGSNLLVHSLVQISSADHTVRITDKAEKLGSLKAAAVTPMELNPQGAPHITVRLGRKQKDNLLFDTGSEPLYNICRKQFDQWRTAGVFDTVIRGYGASTRGLHGLEDQADQYRVHIPELHICDLPFTGVRARTTVDYESRIGATLLQYGTVTMDFPRHKFYFQPYAIPLAARQEPVWNLNLVPTGEKLVVGAVWGPALTEMAITGAEIVAIDGVPCGNMSPCDYMTHSPLSGKSAAVLTLKRAGGDLQQVEIRQE